MTFDRVNTDYQQNNSYPQTGQNASSEDAVDYKELIQAKIEELTEKVKNGDTEPAYQIGGQAFTEEDWDKFLGRFDKLQEKIRQDMEEQQAKDAAEAQVNREFRRELLESADV